VAVMRETVGFGMPVSSVAHGGIRGGDPAQDIQSARERRDFLSVLLSGLFPNGRSTLGGVHCFFKTSFRLLLNGCGSHRDFPTLQIMQGFFKKCIRRDSFGILQNNMLRWAVAQVEKFCLT
jgi:hypothetical protein